jgi:hypothetical protein
MVRKCTLDLLVVFTSGVSGGLTSPVDLAFRGRVSWCAALAVIPCVLVTLSESGRAAAPEQSSSGPRAVLVPATPVQLTGSVDSNSPAIWERVRGRPTIFVFTSFDGMPSRATSTSGFGLLGAPSGVSLNQWPPGRIWLEAVVAAADGTWYGYYHNERDPTGCVDHGGKTVPRLGAMRSINRGVSWKNLGTVLTLRRSTEVCDSPNQYFIGGVGDFSATLDRDEEYLYLFYSQYVRSPGSQGVAVARLPWADRDAPVGKITVYDEGEWVPARTVESTGAFTYPVAGPIFPVAGSWHDDTEPLLAYWGPSVHWNTYLNQYVMLLNRAKDMGWSQEGIYISFAPRLDDPELWTTPRKLLDGGGWYPQVMGLQTESGTDKSAGALARFFMSGTSEYLIQFVR